MAIKDKIHELVDACEDDNTLHEVQDFLQQKIDGKDWWQALPQAEKERTTASLQQADEGKTIPHQHLTDKIWAKFTK